MLRRAAPCLAAVMLIVGLCGAGRGDDMPEPTALLPKPILDKLDMSSEQKERVAQLQKEYDEKGKALLAKARAAFEKKDRKTLEKLRGSADKLREEMDARCLELLTDEQKSRLKELRKGPARVASLLTPEGQARLNLSADQKAKMAQLQQEWEAKMAQLQQEMNAKLLQVLTDEQRKKLEAK